MQHQQQTLDLDLPECDPPRPRSQPLEEGHTEHRWQVWRPEQEEQLRCLYEAGARVPAMATALGRPPRGIAAKLVRLGCINRRQDAPW